MLISAPIVAMLEAVKGVILAANGDVTGLSVLCALIIALILALRFPLR